MARAAISQRRRVPGSAFVQQPRFGNAGGKQAPPGPGLKQAQKRTQLAQKRSPLAAQTQRMAARQGGFKALHASLLAQGQGRSARQTRILERLRNRSKYANVSGNQPSGTRKPPPRQILPLPRGRPGLPGDAIPLSLRGPATLRSRRRPPKPIGV